MDDSKKFNIRYRSREIHSSEQFMLSVSDNGVLVECLHRAAKSAQNDFEIHSRIALSWPAALRLFQSLDQAISAQLNRVDSKRPDNPGSKQARIVKINPLPATRRKAA